MLFMGELSFYRLPFVRIFMALFSQLEIKSDIYKEPYGC